MKDYCWYYAGCVIIIALGIVMIIMACRLYNSVVTLYDVEIKVHYIDGYSEISAKIALAVIACLQSLRVLGQCIVAAVFSTPSVLAHTLSISEAKNILL